MTRFRLSAAFMLFFALLAAMVPLPAFAQTNQSYSLGVVGDNGAPITSGRCRVMTAGGNTDATIYSDPSLATAATNPITINTTSGGCTWFGSADSYDVLILVDGGDYKGMRAPVRGVTRTSGKLVTVTRSTGDRLLAIPFTRSASSVQSTSAYTLPKGALIKETLVETKTAIGASTINVGTSTTGANIISLCHVATTATAQGYANCAPTAILLAASTAITYNTQDHDTAGYIWVKYIETGNGP